MKKFGWRKASDFAKLSAISLALLSMCVMRQLVMLCCSEAIRNKIGLILHLHGTKWGFVIFLTTLDESHSMLKAWENDHLEAVRNSARLESITLTDFENSILIKPSLSRSISSIPTSLRHPLIAPSILYLRWLGRGQVQRTTTGGCFDVEAMEDKLGERKIFKWKEVRMSHFALAHQVILIWAISKTWFPSHCLSLKTRSLWKSQIV